MKLFLNNDLELIPVLFQNWENTFLLHYSWPNMKIALNLYLEH